MLPDGWVRRPLGEIARVASGGTPDRAEPSYWGGDIPWVTTGEIRFNTITDTTERITAAGLKNSSAKLFPAGTLLMAMYGQGKTRGQVAKLGIEAATNQACAAINFHPGHDTEYFFHVLAWKYDLIRRLGNAGTQQNLNAGIIKEIEVRVPEADEQRRIARVLACWDEAITTTERLLTNSRGQKQALMRDVLVGRKRFGRFSVRNGWQATPHGRIPIDWSYPQIAAIAKECGYKLGSREAFPVLSCTKHQGLVDSLRYFNKQVFSADTSSYKVVPRGCFVYATNHIDEGSIGYQDLYEHGLVSPMYTVFKAGDQVDDGYLFRLLKTEHYRQIFAAATNASVDRRGSLRWSEFRKLHVPIPPMAEQRAIAELLALAESEIKVVSETLRSFRAQKEALMAQLLTGKRRLPLPEAAAEAAA